MKFWRPPKGQPLSLVQVEEDVTALVKRYRVRKMPCDQWQPLAFAEWLHLAGIDAELITLGQAQSDKLASLLEGAFKDRLITVPTHPPELREA